MDGFNGAQTEYERELRARREAEAEVTRLRVLLSGQAMQISALSSETKRRDATAQLTKEMTDQMTNLEREVSNLKAERDMTLAEVEVLSASKGYVFEYKFVHPSYSLTVCNLSAALTDPR
jgi:Rho-type GTPase-activating protein 1/2